MPLHESQPEQMTRQKLQKQLQELLTQTRVCRLCVREPATLQNSLKTVKNVAQCIQKMTSTFRTNVAAKCKG